MNKKLYMEWLGKQMDKNSPDGPITEARRRRNRRNDIDYYRAVIAGLLDREDSQKTSSLEPHSLEPKSGLADFQQSAARQSLKIPHVEPIWSYRAKNTLGAALGSNTVYEAIAASMKVAPGAAIRAGSLAAKGLPKFKQRPNSNKVVVRRVAPKPTTALATIPKPTTALATVPKPTTALATVPKGGPIVKKEPTGGPILKKEPKPIVKKEPHVKDEPIVQHTPEPPPPKPTSDTEKPSGASNPLGGTDMNKRDKSRYTQSVHSKPRPGMTPFGIKPGSGEQYGGQVVSESKLNSLVNHHVNKFLKTREGKKLKKEASSILTQKDL